MLPPCSADPPQPQWASLALPPSPARARAGPGRGFSECFPNVPTGVSSVLVVASYSLSHSTWVTKTLLTGSKFPDGFVSLKQMPGPLLQPPGPWRRGLRIYEAIAPLEPNRIYQSLHTAILQCFITSIDLLLQILKLRQAFEPTAGGLRAALPQCPAHPPGQQRAVPGLLLVGVKHGEKTSRLQVLESATAARSSSNTH